MEQLNLVNEGGKSSRRRLSSILKAPRTSMRVPEPEEPQEEVTKPIEKKRISRRVSFAATKNVRVFSKDIKSESPVLASVPNTAVGDGRPDEKILHFVEEGNHQIKGLDTLLNTPLYVSQHLGRENFFSDPVLQDDCVDRTMLIGEETGYMDMTHSHTISIDKDNEIEQLKPDFGLKAAQVIGDQNVAGQKRVSCCTKVETKNPNMDSDFNAFLASISLPTIKNVVPLSSKKELAYTSTSEIDKENHLPPFLMQQVQHSVTKGNPQQPRGLQRRRSRVAFSEDNTVEVTTSHTAVIENRSNGQPVLSFVSGNSGIASTPMFSHDDDMELTQSQTAAINVKLTGNISHNNHSALDHNRSHYFSENDDAMEMTGMFDVSRREKEHAISTKEETSISKASKISHFNVAGNVEIMDRNKPGHFQSNLSMAQPANSDDMEMTETLDVSVQEKENTASMKNESLFLFPKISKKSSFNGMGNGVIVDQNKSGHLSIAQGANYDDMEMTQCQTIVLESKQFSGEKSLVNSRRSLSNASMSSSVQNKEHTASITDGALLQIHRPSKMSSIRNEEIMAQNKSGNLSITQHAYSDDMEMTEALEVSVQEKEYTFSNMKKISLPFSQITKKSSFNVTGNARIMDENGSCCLPIPQTDHFDDMEMTQCQTIVFEAKQFSDDKQLSNSRKSMPHASISSSVQEEDLKMEALLQIHKPGKMPSVDVFRNEERISLKESGNSPIAQTADSDDMEMTEALEVSVQEREYTAGAYPYPQISKNSNINVTGNGKIVDQTKSANFDDMEMTQCQTIVLESKQFGGDKPLSSSRKSFSRALRSETEYGDGMDMTQAFSGRIVLNAHSASNRGKGQSVVLPAMLTSSTHNQSDCMDLTGEPSTFAGIAPPSPDEMELTGCATVNIDSNRTLLAANTTSMRRAPSLENQTIVVSEPMEMTEVQMLPVSERKAVATRKMSERGVLSFPNPKNIEVNNCLKNFSKLDDMEMTQCQTVVLEAENYESVKPKGKSRKSLNLVTSLSRPNVDCMDMTEAFTANIMSRSLVSTEKRKTDRNLLPSAQIDPNCTDVIHQASTLGVDDKMEFTGCNTIAIDTQGTLAGTSAKIKAAESALWASTSVSCPGSSEEQNNASEAAKRGSNHEVYNSKHILFSSNSDLDDSGLKFTNTTKSYTAADMQVDGNSKMAHRSNSMTTGSVDEDNNMQVTKVITIPSEIQENITFNQRRAANVETSRNVEKVAEGLEQSSNSVQLELSSTDSVADSFIKEELRHAKSRRRSLVDFQIELQNMSRRLKEEVLKGATAPLPSCSLPEMSKEHCETAISTEPVSIVTPNVKQKDKSFQNDKTTPFSLRKQPFLSRVSFSGVVPKLSKRATAITPNKTITPSTHDLQCFYVEKHLDVKLNSNCETVNINDEEFPEMSTEEDLSGTLENWPIHKEEERVDSSGALMNEELLENDVFEPDVNTSQALKRPYLEETNVTAEPNKKAYISDMGSDCHEAGVQWEGYFTSHAAQNRSPKPREDTGVYESTLRSSHYESHVDGTSDYEFEFNKKLDDGSITLNEFLSHFSINFVIHKSRPSALPESCRAGETRTMEDLLKEKYIHHPKQRVYEQDCKELTEIVERLKEEIPEQEKALKSINGALQQEICTIPKEQLKSFGAMLKARRVFFGKRSKALSHEMKGVLYSQLIKTTQDAKHQLIGKIKETDELMEELNGCINDLETEIAAIDAAMVGNNHNSSQIRPDLKAKEDDLHKLNSAFTEKEREIDELQIQLKTFEGQEQKLREECSGFKSDLATLNSLNEWRLDETDESGALFTFLHNTVHLQVKLQTPAGKEWMTEDVERKMDVSLHLRLDLEKSECHASMVHRLLELHNKSQVHWMQKYPTTRHIPELLHGLSLLAGRLRLLGEEIHRLKKSGGLRLCIRQITCVDTQIHIMFSSLKAFEKFELSLLVTPDYPFKPLQIQNFQSHIGNTRLSQIEDIVSSVSPGRNYLTKILKNIHSDLLC
ncbi:uncharacterized protein knl1 [Triplophysa dalaica]|uniref:uncharacterized protein knl1 n=1 Tax=Triplophysa dalaica TaxID=1582913 RepID=UPI0024DF79AA|nr:uncharacterized protein knl1 [Triplophysa dalaica]